MPAKFISIFNNKGGVGKTTITWNVADSLGRKGKNVLLIDFDPQCNLSIAMLGADAFKDLVGLKSPPKTIRSYLQGYLQNTGPGNISSFQGPKTHDNVKIVAGDFWLNVYADSLNVGNDLLTGNGISKFVALRSLETKLKEQGEHYDYVLIDLPPSFGGLVRSALYSSDYLIIPCTSDNFSEYCISLIGQMLPQFIADWDTGVSRFKQGNYGLKDFDSLGRPAFGGWIFNGFDTRSDKMLRADKAHFQNIGDAVAKFNANITKSITSYSPELKKTDLLLGKIEDMNVLIQNSIWQNVPVSQLDREKQVDSFTSSKAGWSASQLNLIGEVGKQINLIADKIIADL